VQAASADTGPQTPNPNLALGWFTKACELGEPSGCYNAGLIHKNGNESVGLAKDIPKVSAMWGSVPPGAPAAVPLLAPRPFWCLVRMATR
jgi:TPR repeat protein